MKLLITLLTSYNEFILYECYKSVKNQIVCSIDYEIYIIVNSQNSDYYDDVCRIFTEESRVKIIQTESNGKPGKGHNSLIELFKNNKSYDYLLPIDGDDFLYPYGLKQLEKILIHKPDIVVGGNEDIISNFKEIYNGEYHEMLDNKYFCGLEPNIMINKNMILYEKGTPFRLCLLGRNIFKYNIKKLYCENCKVFDDYLLFLEILNLYYTSSLNIYYISLKNIYIYYKAHISSVCYQNSSNNDDNLEELINRFDLLKKLDNMDIIFKIPSFYIENYTNEKVIFNKDDKNIDYNENEFKGMKQYKLNYDYLKGLSMKIHRASVDFIKSQISKIDKLNINYKKRLYLTLENYVLNDYYDYDLLKYLVIISNNINFIANDIVNSILMNIDLKSFLSESYDNYYEKGDYIYCFLLLRSMKNNYDFKVYHYLYLISKKLNIAIYSNVDNKLILDDKRKTIVLLDAMNIEYDIYTAYERGLGGTQLCYINLATILSKNYNVILLKKSVNGGIKLLNNIYLINYDSINDMCIYINNIGPNVLIYNYIEYGKILKENIDKNIILYMYEHITVYSHYEIKKKCDYYNYYDKIVFVSRDQLYKYKTNCKINMEKNIIFYNRLSPVFYFNKMNDNILESKDLSIIYCSNPQRGLDNLIYIYPLLKEKYKSLKLRIYSSLEMYDLEDNDDLRVLFDNFRKMDGVTIEKCVSQMELVKEMNKSLLFVYPTYVEETFCNSCIEAASCGCSVVATKIGALDEVLENYGDLIDVDINGTSHPYYEIVNKDYIEKVVNKTSIIIEKYLNKSVELEDKLKKQVNFIKKKYNWKFFENLF